MSSFGGWEILVDCRKHNNEGKSKKSHDYAIGLFAVSQLQGNVA